MWREAQRSQGITAVFSPACGSVLAGSFTGGKFRIPDHEQVLIGFLCVSVKKGLNGLMG
jgi:hypothetical protein